MRYERYRSLEQKASKNGRAIDTQWSTENETNEFYNLYGSSSFRNNNHEDSNIEEERYTDYIEWEKKAFKELEQLSEYEDSLENDEINNEQGFSRR